MAIEDTRITEDIRSANEVNEFLKLGWVLIMTYVDDVGEPGVPNGRPHFVVAWQKDSDPEYPTHYRNTSIFKAKSVV